MDISKGEVEHANKRAQMRHESNVSFIHGDMENMEFENETFDKVISNGAFCLAPSKAAALAEVDKNDETGIPIEVAMAQKVQKRLR